MESFSDLLHKLREVHEREVDGWQVKVQELSNKKGCDTKRMEELFNRNQQMKEQQRLLTENIKTLENRLRAGLCDRCTVTQEVAKRRQQEFEASQIQSLQHISILAGEMNSLKKDNRRLKDEIRSLRAAHDSRGYSDHSSNCNSTTEVKLNSSPDRSPSCGPVALVTMATSGVSNQPVDGDVAVKTEADQRAGESERRHVRGMNRSHFESYKPLAMSTLVLPSWRTDHGVTRAGERRAEGLDQRSSVPHQALLKNSSSSMTGEVKPRHVLHAPVPCRPQPIKSNPVSLPWPLSESSDWVTVAAAGTNPVVPTSSKLNLPHFPSMVQTSQQTSPRQQVFGSPWQKPSTPQPPDREPTVVFRLKSLTEYAESQAKPAEKQESPPLKAERVSGEVLKDTYDGPLDLSDRGKSKSIQTPKDDSSLASQAGARVLKSPDMDVNTSPSANTPVSSPSPVVLSSSSCTTTVKHQEKEPPSDRNHQQDVKEQEKKEEVNGKTDQSNGKKVPVLTISLRPVVVLETLNSALQKQESLSSNGKSSAPADEPGSSSDEPDEEESGSGQEGANGCKRKRPSVETETDRDSDTDNIHRERKIKITV